MTQMKEDVGADATAPVRQRQKACRKWVVFLAVVVILLLGWGTLNYLASPAFLTPLAERVIPRFINGEARLGSAVVRSPRDVRAHGLELQRWDAEEPDISVGRIQITLNPWAIFSGQVEPTGVSISEGVLRVEMDENGRISLRDLFDVERRRRPPRDPEDLAGLLVDGVRFDQCAVHLKHPGIFKDDIPRTVSGIRGVLHRGTVGLDWMHFSGEVMDDPFRGVRFDGWTRVRGERQVRIELKGEGLRVGPQLFAMLPKELREVAEPFALEGWADLFATVDLRPGSEPDYNFKFNISGASLRLPMQDMPIEAASAKLNVVPGTVDFVLDSGFLFQAQLSGASVIRMNQDDAIPMLASLNFGHMNLSQLLNHLMPGERPRPGRVGGTARLQGDLANPETLVVRGDISLRDAVLVELPIFAQLFAVLNLSISRGETVRSGELRYRIELANERFYVERLDLRSRNVEMRSRGWIGFDGSLDVRVVTALPEATDRGILAPLRNIFRTVVDGVTRIVTPPVRITGTVQDPKFEVMAVEHIGRPLTSLFDVLDRVAGTGADIEEKEF